MKQTYGRISVQKTKSMTSQTMENSINMEAGDHVYYPYIERATYPFPLHNRQPLYAQLFLTEMAWLKQCFNPAVILFIKLGVSIVLLAPGMDGDNFIAPARRLVRGVKWKSVHLENVVGPKTR